MNLYQATEECPGCGIFFEVTSELTKVDFSGREFLNSEDESENR